MYGMKWNCIRGKSALQSMLNKIIFLAEIGNTTNTFALQKKLVLVQHNLLDRFHHPKIAASEPRRIICLTLSRAETKCMYLLFHKIVR